MVPVCKKCSFYKTTGFFSRYGPDKVCTAFEYPSRIDPISGATEYIDSNGSPYRQYKTCYSINYQGKCTRFHPKLSFLHRLGICFHLLPNHDLPEV